MIGVTASSGVGDPRNVHNEEKIRSAWWNYITDLIVTTTAQLKDAHQASTVSIVYLKTLPHCRIQKSSSLTQANMIHIIDCSSSNCGCSLFSDTHSCDTSSDACHVDDLSSILRAIQQRVSLEKKDDHASAFIVLMLDSIVPIVFRHGLYTTLQFLQSLRRLSKIFLVPVSVEMPSILFDNNYNNDIGGKFPPGTTWILSKADAIFNCDCTQGVKPCLQIDWWRRGIRETGQSLRETIQYEIISSDDNQNNNNNNNQQQQITIRILPTSNHDDSSNHIMQQSKVSTATNTDPTSDKIKKNKMKLQVHEGGRDSRTSSPPQHPTPPPPTEAFNDEELMFGDEDYDDEDPDDDLDL
jgi:hypothetical protein